MDYKRMWERLHKEINYLIEEGVQSIHPIIVEAYMNYVVETELYREKEERYDKEIGRS